MEDDMAEELSPGCARPTENVVGEAAVDLLVQFK
jgi:hypothetical protein